MRGREKKQLCLLFMCIITLVLFCVHKYLENSSLFHENESFIKVFLPINTSSIQLWEGDGIINRINLVNNLSSKNPITEIANISVKVYNSENEGKIFKVEYPNHKTNSTSIQKKNNLFFEMKDIKKSTLNVFFVETSCATEKASKGHKNNNGFVLNARQCCAIESTAVMNLNRDIYVLHSCPLEEDFIVHSPKFTEQLMLYPNVHVVRVNNTELFFGTPIQDLYETKKLESSYYPIEHTSDAFRFALLWKFGGTYCDLDVVTIRSLHSLKTNWAGVQDTYTIASGVLNFEPYGIGHRILQQALDHMNTHFNGANWSSNGPELITKFILQECRVPNVTEAIKNCHINFTTYKTDIFYPLYYTETSKLFDENIGKNVVMDVKSRAFSVHIWNKMSHGKKGKVGSTQAYALLADEFCPGVYQNCGNEF